jgi:hypothetical protein
MMSAIYGGGQLSIFVGWIVVCLFDEYAHILDATQFLEANNPFQDVSHYLSPSWPPATQPLLDHIIGPSDWQRSQERSSHSSTPGHG